MKIALVQKDINNLDISSIIAQAANSEPDLICLGELAVTGCMYEVADFPTVEEVLASVKNIEPAVSFGLPIREDSEIFNCYIFCHNGNYQIYRKQNLFEPMGEDAIYRAGERPGLFETEFGLIGVAICYDLRFDDVFADLAALKPDLIMVPAAWPQVRISDWKRLLKQRARKVGAPIIGINAVGNDGQNQFGGSSMAVDSKGELLAEADQTSEAVLIVNL